MKDKIWAAGLQSVPMVREATTGQAAIAQPDEKMVVAEAKGWSDPKQTWNKEILPKRESLMTVDGWQVTAYDRKDGAVKWSVELPSEPLFNGLAIAADGAVAATHYAVPFRDRPHNLDWKMFQDRSNYEKSKERFKEYLHIPDLGVHLDITLERAAAVNDAIWSVVAGHPYTHVSRE